MNRVHPVSARTRDLVTLALAISALIALGLLIGPLWVARAGGVVAVVTVVVAIWLARRELSRVHRRHADEVTRLLHEADAVNKRHHKETMQVITRYSAKVAHLRSTIAEVRDDLSTARTQLATSEGELRNRTQRLVALRTTNSLLADANTSLAGANAELRTRVQQLEALLADEETTLRETVDAAILTLPRRAVSQLRAELRAQPRVDAS